MGLRLTNAEIADKLSGLAHLLTAKKENPFKVKAYQRAAKLIRALGESVAERVEEDADLTEYAGIGPAIAGVVREIVETGTTRQIGTLESELSPELAAVVAYPQLDPRRILRVYKKLNISTIDQLKEKLEAGEIARSLGPRIEHHVRRGLAEHEEILLYEADRTVAAVEKFLITRCGVARGEAAGEYRRRMDVIGELHFLARSRPREPCERCFSPANRRRRYVLKFKKFKFRWR